MPLRPIRSSSTCMDPDRNLDHEVNELDAPIVQRLVPLLRDHPLIVVGYRGNEPSVMNGLLLEQIGATNTFAQGVYWCVRESDLQQPLSPLVKELATAIGTNFQVVPIAGFDELLQYDLWD